MAHQYAQPPIVEAICEFRFTADQEWDLTVPGLVYGEIKDEFPVKRTRENYEVGLAKPKTDEEPLGFRGQVSQWMQCVREDESALIQVGPHLLTVNQVGAYPGWPDVSAMIARGLEAYRTVATPKSLQRIGLRYINRLEFPETASEEIQISRYLHVGPRIPEGLPTAIASWAQKVEIPYPEKNGMLALQTGSLREEKHFFMLDLDFRTLDAGEMTIDDALTWVDGAHAVVEDSFEACITDDTRELFVEKDHDRRKA